MRIMLKLTFVTVALVGLTGCESFDRFEAWKMEAIFGVPNPYNAEPVYGQPQYGQPVYAQPMYGQPVYGQPVYGQPVYGQPTMYYGQPAPTMQPAPIVSGQAVPAGYVQVVPQAVVPQPAMQPLVQPVSQPQALLPPASN